MYPSTIYRLTAKALITNDEGRVLVVKEKGDFWSLPGGGVEHGETAATCLQREITEEIGIEGAEVREIVHSTTVYLDHKDAWMTWVVYRANVPHHNFVLGDGVTAAKFIDISELADTTDILEKLIVESVNAAAMHAQLASATKPARYRHYKGMEYEVLDTATHTESGEPLVVYRALYPPYALWARPEEMFFDTVEKDGESFPRFTKI